MFAYGFIQMTQLIISLPFAVLRLHILPNGIQLVLANIAYYGFGFIIYAIFNLIFLTQFFKTAYRLEKHLYWQLYRHYWGIFMEVIVHFQISMA